MITASAPGKLLLFGEHAVVYGKPCIVTAVDQRLFVAVKKNGVDVFHMDAPDLGLTAYSKTIDELGKKELPKGVRFIEHLYKRFLEQHPQSEGIIVTTKSDFSASYGFGSSSAVTVAFAKALTELYGLRLSKKDLFDLCYQAVLDVQGVGSGFDIASAIWGGTIFYVQSAQVLESIEFNKLPLVVGYTGVKADTPTLIRLVSRLRSENTALVNGIFDEIERICLQAKQALRDGNWKMVGELMKENQALLRQLSVSSNELEKLIQASLEAGALGAKLSGAGGGDCMIAIGNNRDAIASAIEKVSGQVLQVRLDAPGVRLEQS